MEVAAFIDGIWMLAEVTGVFAASKYEVKDIDDEQKAKYIARRSRMIPLPRWRADPMRDSHALFPVGAIVLALYPQTTCFYKVINEVLELRESSLKGKKLNYIRFSLLYARQN